MEISYSGDSTYVVVVMIMYSLHYYHHDQNDKKVDNSVGVMALL